MRKIGAGTALAWSAPAILSMSVAGAATDGSPAPCNCDASGSIAISSAKRRGGVSRVTATFTGAFVVDGSCEPVGAPTFTFAVGSAAQSSGCDRGDYVNITSPPDGSFVPGTPSGPNSAYIDIAHGTGDRSVELHVIVSQPTTDAGTSCSVDRCMLLLTNDLP